MVFLWYLVGKIYGVWVVVVPIVVGENNREGEEGGQIGYGLTPTKWNVRASDRE